MDAGAFGSGSLGLSPPPQPAAREHRASAGGTAARERSRAALSRLESGAVEEELVTQEVELPGGPLRVLQPRESAELPDDGPVEWAPLVPYWSVLWRSGVALARELDAGGDERTARRRAGLRPGAAEHRRRAAGATVLATDADPEALELAARNARAERGADRGGHGVDWTSPPPSTARPRTVRPGARGRRALRAPERRAPALAPAPPRPVPPGSPTRPPRRRRRSSTRPASADWADRDGHERRHRRAPTAIPVTGAV